MMARHKWLVTCGHSLIVGPHCLGQLAGPRRVSELPRAWLLAGSRGWVIPGSQPLLRPGSTGGDDASLEVGFELLLFLFCSSFGCRLQCALIRAPGSWDLCWSCWLTLLLQALTFAKGRAAGGVFDGGLLLGKDRPAYMRRRRIEVLGFTLLEAIHFIDIGVTRHHSHVSPILAPGSLRYCFEGLTASCILFSSRL